MLLLGAAGFAGRHLRAVAEEAGIEVIGTSRREGAAELRCDLLDSGSVDAALRESDPDLVANLAGEASVSASWRDPERPWAIHETGTRKLIERASRQAPEATVLLVSSAEVYGLVPEAEQPISEARDPSPVNPYGESKLALERVCAEHRGDGGARVVLARPFSHTGPGQGDGFAPSAFARQVAEAESSGADRVELRVGDLSPRRDFSDVRDVARAYLAMLRTALPGPFNVCSGAAVPIGHLVDLLAQRTELEIEIRPDTERMRPVDIPLQLGSNRALHEATGWAPCIPLERTMGDLLDWWREGRP
jgi:GDP-4-dehydro-6-deoxy-D-mannose reductase